LDYPQDSDYRDEEKRNQSIAIPHVTLHCLFIFTWVKLSIHPELIRRNVVPGPWKFSKYVPKEHHTEIETYPN
jgi:hypothetical protein